MSDSVRVGEGFILTKEADAVQPVSVVGKTSGIDHAGFINLSYVLGGIQRLSLTTSDGRLECKTSNKSATGGEFPPVGIFGW